MMERPQNIAVAGLPGECRGRARRSRLVTYLAIGYTLLVAYATVYPFREWRSPADGMFAFVSMPWPRYYTFFDLLVNVLAYIPLGFLLVLAALPWLSGWLVVIAATLAGTALSLALEAVQSFLPARVASNLDLLNNGLGALTGALLAAAFGERWFLSGNLFRLRQRVFLHGARVDLGFVLLLLWLFTQLNPEVWLFGNGDFRPLIAQAGNLEFSPESYRWIETGVTAFNLAGICVFTATLARRGQGVFGPLLVLVAAALLLKSVAALTLFKPGDVALWLTPGSMLGIPAGLLLYLPLARLPRRGMALAALGLILFGAALLNYAPENPYIQASVQTWRYGHFLSFNGATQLISTVWPLMATAYLLWWTLTPHHASYD
jgi:VanZ family protein